MSWFLGLPPTSGTKPQTALSTLDNAPGLSWKEALAISHGENKTSALPRKVVLPPLDNDQLQSKHTARREKAGAGYVFAVARSVDLSPQTTDGWKIQGNRAVWELALQSPGAENLNLGLEAFTLPTGGRFSIYKGDDSTPAVVFTEADNDDHGQLWTPIVRGDSLRLALNVPKDSREETVFAVTKINHGFRRPTAGGGKAIGDDRSETCNIDVVCRAEDDPRFGPLVDLFRDQIDAVAAYTVDGTTTCSGSLIAAAGQNRRRPFFLTAWHCEVRASNAPSVVAYWNFQNTTCRRPGSTASGLDGDGRIDQFNSGAIFRSGDEATDFCLLEFDDPINSESDAYFAGWDRSSALPQNVVGIHHPAVSEKRISFDLDSTTATELNSPSPTSAGRYLRVADWDFGTTEGGSSGSPLFSNAGLIVGQLQGGNAACGNNLSDWYGRLSRSWAGNGTDATRLSNWLDPEGSAGLTLSGYRLTPEVILAAKEVLEGNEEITTVAYEVRLSEAVPDRTVTARIESRPGTARSENGDFVPLVETVTFSPGSTSQSISLQVTGNSRPERDRSFELFVAEAQNARGRTPGKITIKEDDFLPLKITGPSEVEVLSNQVVTFQILTDNFATNYSVLNAPDGTVVDAKTGKVFLTGAGAGLRQLTLIASNPSSQVQRTITLLTFPNRLGEALDLQDGITTSSTGFVRQSNVTNDGVDAAQAAPITHDQTTGFIVNVTGPGLLTFDWRVSSEKDYDILQFRLNGSVQQEISGVTDWVSQQVQLPAGPQEVSFVYQKDESVGFGADTGWVDQLKFFPTDVTAQQTRIYYVGEPIGESLGLPAGLVPTGLPAGLSYDRTSSRISGTVLSPLEQSVSFQGTIASGAAIAVPYRIQVLSVPPLRTAIGLANGRVFPGGTGSWTIEGANDHLRTDGAITEEGTTLSLWVEGPGTLAFDWQLQTNQAPVRYSVKRAGELLFSRTASFEWRQDRVALAPGLQEVVFRAERISSGGGTPVAFLDNIQLNGFAEELRVANRQGGVPVLTADEKRDLFIQYIGRANPILTATRSSGGELGLTATLAAALPDVKFQLQQATNLSDQVVWEGIADGPSRQTLVGGRIRLTFPPQPTEAGRGFYRVNASPAQPLLLRAAPQVPATP